MLKRYLYRHILGQYSHVMLEYFRKKGKLGICHSMRGRLRVKCDFIQASKERAFVLERWLSRQEQVERIETEPVSGNVILFYNPAKADADMILGLVRKAISVYHQTLKSIHTVDICHSMRGRLRVKSEFIRSSKERAFALEQWLSQQDQVERVETSPVSGNIVLFYDPDKGDVNTILDLVRKALDEVYFTVLPSPLLPAGKGGIPARTFTIRLIELGALTAFTAYTVVRWLMKAPLPQGTFSLVSAVSLIGAIPLFSHALDDLRQGKITTLFPFLAFACLLAITMGQATAALEIIWVLRVGMLLDDYVAEKSRKAISETFKIAEKETYVLIDGAEVQRPTNEVLVGETVVARTGERIPVDGIITHGQALVDEAHITGRAEPEWRKANDSVFAGTMIQQGVLYIRAEKVGEQTYLSRTLHLVESSLAERSPAEKQADILAARLSRLGLILTFGTFVLTADPLRAVTVMIIMTCPCATVLAVSTAVSAAIANAARNRSLIKGGLYLEMVGKTDCYCFDKTGTITEDRPHVVEVVPRTPTQTKFQILALAASAEAHAEHPIARALVEAAASYDLPLEPFGASEVILGRGVKTNVDGVTILVGNTRFMDEEGINTNYYKRKAQKFIETGHTLLYVARNGKLQGMIAIVNPIRPLAKDVLDWLRKDGVAALYLVTGDTESVAREIAETLGFNDYRANFLPEDKANYLDGLKRDGRRVVMIGDGINDALAFSHSSLSIAMGAGGAEAVVEMADIALVDSNLERLVTQRQLSHQTMKIIEQNYSMAVSTNIVGITLAAAGWLSPIMAGAIHIVHTLGIMTNSSRLLTWETPGLEEKKTSLV
jgi:cation-transporting P-type ATPase C